MPTPFYGINPIILTVQASPTPTASSFAVNDATDLKIGQFINVRVLGQFQRTKIENIVGNQVTVNTVTYPLTGAPDTPGEVRSRRQLITDSIENAKGFFNASSPADLATLNTQYIDPDVKYWVKGYGPYRWESGSSLDADGVYVIATAAANGRFLYEPPVSLAPAAGEYYGELLLLQERIAALEQTNKVNAHNPETVFDVFKDSETRIVVIEALAPETPNVIAAGGYHTAAISLGSKIDDLNLNFSIRKGDAIFFAYGERAEGLIIGQPIIEGVNFVRLNFYNPTGSSFNLKSARSTFTIIQKGSEILNG